MTNRIDYAKASPEGFKAFGGVYTYLRKCGLSEELVDLVYLRVSQINGCVAETGVPDADYEVAAAEFGDKELADLTYAIGLMNAFNRFGITFRSTPTAAAKT
jgi:alkylhydroperoxidase family enzyme